jgi:hypothetical protein
VRFLDPELTACDGLINSLIVFGYSYRWVSSTSPLRLDVEYARSMRTDANDTATVASQRTSSSRTVAGGGVGSAYGAVQSVVYTLRARLVDASAPTAVLTPLEARTAARLGSNGGEADWGLEVPVTISNHVKCQGGQAFTGLDAAGVNFTAPSSSHAEAASSSAAFSFQVTQTQFSGKGTLSTYPVTSAPTAARHPDTAARVQTEVDRVRAWMHVKLNLHFPPMFRVIFDADAVTCYERVFGVIMKVSGSGALLFIDVLQT